MWLLSMFWMPRECSFQENEQQTWEVISKWTYLTLLSQLVKDSLWLFIVNQSWKIMLKIQRNEYVHADNEFINYSISSHSLAPKDEDALDKESSSIWHMHFDGDCWHPDSLVSPASKFLRMSLLELSKIHCTRPYAPYFYTARPQSGLGIGLSGDVFFVG